MAFGENLFALYVYGAITFPETEGVVDLDYHVIVERWPDEAQVARYRALGADLEQNHAPWGTDLDDWVILREQASGSAQPEHVVHSGLKDGSWALHRAHWLAGRCLVLFGPDPSGVVLAPMWAELADDLLGELSFAEKSRHDAFAVLNSCRILHSFASRDVVHSKFGSAAWAVTNLPSEHHAPIRAAMATYRGNATAEDKAALAHGRRALLDYVHCEVTTHATDNWLLNERSMAGGEHLSPEYVAGYDRKAGFDPEPDLDLLTKQNERPSAGGPRSSGRA